MIGWEFFVYRQGRTPRFGVTPELLVVRWTAGGGGLRWLEPLKNGQVTYLSGNGYPHEWRITAGVLRTALDSGVLKIDTSGTLGSGCIHVEVYNRMLLDSLEPDEVLEMDAWDQS